MRNTFVEATTDLIVRRLDSLIAGGTLSRPVPQQLQRILDDHATRNGGSVRLASIFLLAYSLVDEGWDFDTVPTGIRGQYGDKRFAASLTERYVTYHNAITAFGENLGWKGNVKNFVLSRDRRINSFLSAVKALDRNQRDLLLEHAVWRLYESRVVPKAIPALPPTYLTYARACLLCDQIIALRSEGHLQQFLVAAFLSVHRSRTQAVIRTHHPHAADKFGGTYGDIEELRDGTLVAAYEVTVRPDWKNRLPDLHEKMKSAGLARYVVIASGVSSDSDLSPANHLVGFTDSLPFDLAVVDIDEFFRVFCAELCADELARSFNLAYDFARDPKLCGRADFIEAYAGAVAAWLDAGSE